MPTAESSGILPKCLIFPYRTNPNLDLLQHFITLWKPYNIRKHNFYKEILRRLKRNFFFLNTYLGLKVLQIFLQI